MDSVANDDLNPKPRIVYTRRPRKKIPSVTTQDVSSTSTVREPPPVVQDEDLSVIKSGDKQQHDPVEQLPMSDEVENLKTPSRPDNEKKLPNGKEGNSSGNEVTIVKPLVTTRVDDRIRFNVFKETSNNEIEDLRKKLEFELHEVRMQVEKLEAKKLQLSLYNNPLSNTIHGNDMIYASADVRNVVGFNNVQSQHPIVEHAIDNRALMRVNSEVGMMGHQEFRPMVLSRVNSDMGAARNLEPRPYSRQLSVAVTENNYRDIDFIEKEKRTPKANQYYRNSEFLLGKDRLPPESNKRLKANNGRKHSVQTNHAYGYGPGFEKIRNQGFKSCSSLLQRLMKHKHGWVFNEPVNAKALGLADYHDIIKFPMDLGTIKNKLTQNYYKSPREFADDVRLVFRNAMTYNPKGHDVHLMAEELSHIFEERWAVIETECNHYWNYQMYMDVPTPTSRKAIPPSHFAPNSVPRDAVLPLNVLARTETMPGHVPVQRPHIVRTPVPKKPKARDLNKRDMTHDEKQKLSTNLQVLPAEKLDAIVQIIKRRNTAMSQHDDEIEVDIDNVDAETLWELDRFVTNYKKSLSKNKRKAEHALQARQAANGTVVPMNTGAAVAEMQPENAALGNGDARPAVDGENQRYNNGSRSSSSSSSSSDSGSSSDSDSDSSSEDRSMHSPKT